MRLCPPLPRVLVLLAVLALTGCSGGAVDGGGAAAPSASSAPAPAAPVSAAPSPSSGPDRSPEALAALSKFSTPQFKDQLVREAVEGYGEFVKELTVAQGLADPDYPPLLALIEPRFVGEALGNTRANIKNGAYLLGPRTDTVIDAAGSDGQVFLSTCSDLGQRVGYYANDDSVGRPAKANVVPANVTMVRGAKDWVISAYVRNEEVVCP